MRLTLASIGDGVIATDAEARVTFLNYVAEALTGWTQAGAAGKPHVEIFRIIDESTRKEVENPALRALRGGAIAGLANHTLLIAKDGSERPINDSAAPIRNGGGAVSGAVLVFRDITERRLDEKTAGRLAAIVTSSEDAIISKDLEGVIMSWNRGVEHLFGYTSEEMIGHPVTLLIPDGHVDEEPRILERIKQGEMVDHYETVRRRKDGELLDISLTVSPLKDALGRVIGSSMIARNMSEHKRAQQGFQETQKQLQKTSEELSRFNDLAIGREPRMIELKKEINELCKAQGEPIRFPLEFEEAGTTGALADVVIEGKD
ncbi:MAG: PAS domain-containing protein [Fimbriimonadales bacterium]